MLRPSLSLAVLVLLPIVCGACAGRATSQQAQEDDPLYRMRLAESLAHAGRTTEALAKLQEGLDDDPSSAGLNMAYGRIAFIAGRYADAERTFRLALQADPSLSDAHNFLGAIYQEQGRHDDAEREYREALSNPVYPSPELVWLNLGLLHVKQGRLEEAEQDLRRSVELNPRYYKGHYELAALLEGQGELDEAAREYEVAAPDFRNSGEYQYRLGLTYWRLGQQERSREHLERALAVAPGSPSAEKAGELLEMLD